MYGKTYLINHEKILSFSTPKQVYNDKKAILSELHRGIHIIWLLNKAVVFVLQDREGGCTVRQMTVNFAELGWGEWIISPDKFDANYCTGSCRFPLTKVKQLISVVS